MNIIEMTFADDVANIIRDYETEKEQSSTNWASMVQAAIKSGAHDKNSYYEAMWPSELIVLEFRESNGEPDLRNKNGSFKKTKVCNNSTYSSSKSVIGKALDAGVLLADELTGEVVPKSELEKRTKEVAGSTKTAFEKAMLGYNQIANQWGSLTATEQASILSSMGELAKQAQAA